MRFLPHALLILFACGSYAVRAETYFYTGSTYDFSTAPYSPDESITGSFTFSDELPANESVLTGYSILPESFSFTDGVQTINQMNAIYSVFGPISTDAVGHILNYSFYMDSPLGTIFVTDESNSIGLYSFGADQSGFGESFTKGTLTPSSLVNLTPEPSSVALCGTGACGLFAIVRRRRRVA